MTTEHIAPGERATAHARPGPVIIEADLVTKTFTTPDGRALPVLDDVSFSLHEGEIVALLGKSGSGKSTLLRCVAGLIAPSAGTVTYRGTPLNGANPGVAMVFQSFALLPWLTVQQNVELAMQARDVPEEERRDKALRALHATSDGSLREGFFLDLLRRGFSDGEARRQLDTAIEWGRYGELFEYDAERGELILEPEPAGHAGPADPS